MIRGEPILLVNNGNVGFQSKGLKAAKDLVGIDRLASCLVKIIDTYQPFATMMFGVKEAQ
jgi:hypothetical protein